VIAPDPLPPCVERIIGALPSVWTGIGLIAKGAWFELDSLKYAVIGAPKTPARTPRTTTLYAADSNVAGIWKDERVELSMLTTMVPGSAAVVYAGFPDKRLILM
jgi:hypothetical protein